MRAYYIKKSANSFVKEHRISSGTINSLKSLTDTKFTDLSVKKTE